MKTEQHITFETGLTKFGQLITIYRDGESIGRMRQIGDNHPDCRLEWLTWQNHQATQNAIQFPFVHLADVTQADIENVVNKYLKE